jgi:hypothetical protein
MQNNCICREETVKPILVDMYMHNKWDINMYATHTYFTMETSQMLAEIN